MGLTVIIANAILVSHIYSPKYCAEMYPLVMNYNVELLPQITMKLDSIVRPRLLCHIQFVEAHSKCMFYLFQSFIEPILLYGSDGCGLSTCAGNKLDSVMLSFIRNVLHVKSATNNVISVGETGQILPSYKSHMDVFAYLVRLMNLPKSMCVRNVFDELKRLYQHGFSNWYSNVLELSRRYGINLYDISNNEAKFTIKTKVTNYFKQNWSQQLHDGDDNTVLRTYGLFKERHEMEPYLNQIKESKYRIAIRGLPASSHVLEIERER